MVVALENASNSIIDDDDEKVTLYLSNLQMLWHLGTRKTKKRSAPMTVDGRHIAGPQRPAINADGHSPDWTTDPVEADRDAFQN
jgi:hypothetical protein